MYTLQGLTMITDYEGLDDQNQGIKTKISYLLYINLR